MRKKIYYSAGVLCLVLSALILLNTNILPHKLTNSAFTENTDSTYKEYYHVGFPMPKNSLRRGTVYLPLYSMREEHHLWQITIPFAMQDAEVTEHDEYFEVSAEKESLRIYRFIDLVEYESFHRNKTTPIDDSAALEIAENFLHDFLSHKKPYDTKVIREDNEIKASFTQHLAALPNAAFPTEITMDACGNIMRAAHFFFDYEAIGSADIISVRTALSRLPRDHEDRIGLKGYDLVYGFEDSVLVPVYRFYGECPDGILFEYHIGALKFY